MKSCRLPVAVICLLTVLFAAGWMVRRCPGGTA